jgi:hypothetical protein
LADTMDPKVLGREEWPLADPEKRLDLVQCKTPLRVVSDRKLSYMLR